MNLSAWESRAPEVGSAAPDPELLDASGKPAELGSLSGPLVVLFFPWPVGEATTRVLRDLRDSTLLLERAGVRIAAVSTAEPSALAFFRTERGLAFPIFSDPDGTATAQWGMSGELGLFVVDRNFVVRMRALGERAPASALLTFLRRGGAKAARSPARLFEQAGAALARIVDAFRPHGTSARAVR